MNEDNSLEKLLQLEYQFNTYQTTKQEAIERAKPLITEYNSNVKKLALKFKMKPKLINMRRFNFGRG